MKILSEKAIKGRSANLLKANHLKKTVNQVFKHKGIEQSFPVKLSKADYKQFEKLWKQYRDKNKLSVKEINPPEKFEKIVLELNTFLSKAI